jgi:UDP-glucose 4-epimerase
LKVFVTGGAGFIGSHLANVLVEIGSSGDTIESRDNQGSCDVIALDDLSLGSRSNLSKEVRFLKGSVMNYDLVQRLSKGCDYIFHQAALSSSPMFLEDPRKGMDVNVIGFMNIMESAKINKVRKVIYASSSSLYNSLPTPYKESDKVSPRTFYEASFYCREMIARTYNLEYGVESTGLRYFSVYGPNERHKGRFANTISQFIWDMAEMKKSPIIYGDGSQTRDFTFVDDVVQANILSMAKPNRYGNTLTSNDNNIRNHPKENPGFNIYNVGTGIETSFVKIVEILNSELGTNIKPTFVENPINSYVRRTLADISLAKKELGYEPKWKNVEDGIRNLLNLRYLVHKK